MGRRPGDSADRDEATPAPVPWRAVALLGTVIAVMAAGLALRAEIQGALHDLEDVVRSAGWAGPLLYVAVYVAWTVACLPGSLVTIAGGSLFAHEPVLAVAAASAGSTLGAAASFLIARHLARDAVRRWVGASDRLEGLDRAIERHGAWVVAVTRLVPLFPFNLLNYGFGLTRVSFWKYVIVSWAAMLPATLVYVLGASAVTRGLSEGRVPWPIVLALAAGLAVTLGLGLGARRRWATAAARDAARDAARAEGGVDAGETPPIP